MTCITGIPAIVTLGEKVDVLYYSGLVVWLVLVAGYVKLSGEEKLQKKRVHLRTEWGKATDRKRDFEDIEGFHISTSDAKDGTCLDDQTWMDMNKDQLYTVIARTFTSPGQSMLYKILR
ncbi:MAG: hypothetical protein HQ515_00330, partial [Phycisphaeraceae bacterium]|nr:hypothetical protein [Phycisphaeraceae bacterium]